MRIRPVQPAGDAVDTGHPNARDRLRELYELPDPAWLRLNLIAGVDGGARGPDGTSTTLSSAADRSILGAIRSLADVVLIGARTLRAEGYLVPRSAQLAVVTSTGRLSPARTSGARAERAPIIVLGPARVEESARDTLTDSDVDFVPLPDANGRLSPADVVTALRDRGAASIVCEGGPDLAAQLLDGGLVDELCLSTSPRLTGGELPMLGGAGVRALDLHRLLVDGDGGIYARWLTAAR